MFRVPYNSRMSNPSKAKFRVRAWGVGIYGLGFKGNSSSKTKNVPNYKSLWLERDMA